MKRSRSIVCTLVLSGVASIAMAQEPVAEDIEAEQVQLPENNALVSGILIGTYQSASQDRVGEQTVKDESNGQLYLFAEMDRGPGTWGMEVRGGTTPHEGGVTSFYGEVNDSVGGNVELGWQRPICCHSVILHPALGWRRFESGSA